MKKYPPLAKYQKKYLRGEKQLVYGEVEETCSPFVVDP
jgi:hypothetical protein